MLSPIFLYLNGASKIEKFESQNKIKNDYIIRVIGSKIELDRFYGNSDTASVINELIDISEPDLDEKILFIWPEGIIPNINKSEFKNFESLFNQKFNKNHLLGIGINNFENNENDYKFYNSFSFFDHELNLFYTYNKVNLVPFGEFLPLQKILKRIGLKSLTNNYQSFSSGKDRKIIHIKKMN